MERVSEATLRYFANAKTAEQYSRRMERNAAKRTGDVTNEMKLDMIKINEADFPLKDGGFGRIAIFMYAGDEDPKPILESAVEKYTEGSNRNFITLIDAHMNCPWIRAIVSNIDEMEQMPFDKYMKIITRDRKIKDLGI